MSDKRHVSFRAPIELVETIEQFADDADVSVSEAWRSAARSGLIDTSTDSDHLEGAKAKQQIEEIKQATYPTQRRAWYRANVGGRLLSAFNSGLNPSEAEMDLSGYRREAIELHEDSDLVEFVDEGLSAYRAAYENGRKTLLVNWVKDRAALPDDFEPDDDRPDAAEDAHEPADGGKVTPEDYRQQVEDGAYYAIEGIIPVEEQSLPDRYAEPVGIETFRDDVEAVLSDDENADLRGIELLNDDAESQTQTDE